MSRVRERRSAAHVRPDPDLFADVFHAHPLAMALTRFEDGLIVDLNGEFTRLTGFEREEAIGRTTTELRLWAHPEERGGLVAVLERTDSAEHRSTEIRTRDGGVAEVRFSARVIDHGGERYLLTTLEDTSQEDLAHEELRLAEAKFRRLVEAIPAVVYTDVADDSMVTSYVSPQIEALLGVTPDEYTADPDLWERHLHPEDRERTMREYREGRGSGRPYTFEYRMITTDGRCVWVRDEFGPVLGEDGHPQLLQGIMHDITHVKVADEAVRQSEALLRATIESTTDGILVVGPDGRTLYANQRFAEMWRIPPDMLERRDDDEMLEYVLDQLVDPEAFTARVRELYAGDRGRSDAGEARESFDTLRFKDGRIFERYTRPVITADQQAARVWSFRDVTDRHRSEEQLRESEERYRTLVEHIPAVTYVEAIGAGSADVFTSPQIEDLIGFTPREWRTDHLWAGRVHPDDRERVTREVEHVHATGMPFRSEYRLIARDGREVWVQDEAVFLSEKDGVKRWQGFMFDITERRRAEEELRTSMELLTRSHAERQLLLGRLVAAQEEERQRIAADIHDDPIQKMTAVGLRLEAFKRREAVAEHHLLLEELERSVELAIGRLRHLMFELRPPALDRDGLAAALRQELDELAREEDLDVRLDDRLSSEPPSTSRTMAFRIAQEALVNARKHASSRRIDVLLESRDEGLFVRIRDDGIGFDLEECGSRPGHLGLTAMRERTEMAGGWFRVDSSPQSGTTVEFLLPIRDGES